MPVIESSAIGSAGTPARELSSTLGLLRRWLVDTAYPLWADQGIDWVHGGFHELLGREGPILGEPRRARVQVRQIYAFARAPAFGWQGDAANLVTHGWDYFFKCYQRPDGLFRTLVAVDGTALDDRAWLYDQAFVLLAMAASRKILGPTSGFDAAAAALLSRMIERLKSTGPGFLSGVPDVLPLQSNPHMHLLEAALEWRDISHELIWSTMAADIVRLALEHMIDAGTGALFERFDAQWRTLATSTDRLVEPGHQFEWAWLLLRAPGLCRDEAIQVATRLVDVGERRGVRHGVAINALRDDLTPYDRQARLWPQTERLKAALAMMKVSPQEPRHCSMATDAALSVLRFLDTDLPGLWYDLLGADGEFLNQPSPASTFYHIVSAAGEAAAMSSER